VHRHAKEALLPCERSLEIRHLRRRNGHLRRDAARAQHPEQQPPHVEDPPDEGEDDAVLLVAPLDVDEEDVGVDPAWGLEPEAELLSFVELPPESDFLEL
jgi:hypothetical protein